MKAARVDRLSPADLAVSLLFAVLVATLAIRPMFDRVAPAIGEMLVLVPEACLVVIMLILLFRRGGVSRYRTAAFIASLFFIALAVVSALVVVWSDPVQSVYGLRALIIAPLSAILLQTSGISDRGLRIVKTVLLLSILGNMFAAMRQAVQGMNAVEMAALESAGATYQVQDQVRLIGWQATGQDLSIVAGSAAVWCWGVIVSRGFRKSGALVALVAVSSTAVTLIVLQRSALIGFCVAAITMLAITWHGARLRHGSVVLRRWLSVGLIGALGLVAMAVFAPDRMDLALERLQSLFALSVDHSFAERQSVTLPVSLDLIAANPFGYGVGASGPVASSLGAQGPLGDYPLGGIAADNGYIFVTLQLGFLGLLSFLAMLLLWMKSGRLVRVGLSTELSARGVIAYLMGIMLSGSFWALTGATVPVLLLASIPERSAVRDRGRQRRHPAGMSPGIRSSRIDWTTEQSPRRFRQAHP